MHDEAPLDCRALNAPVFALEMSGHVLDLHRLVAQQAWNRIQLFLATPLVLWTGSPFFTRALASVRSRSLNMFSLVAPTSVILAAASKYSNSVPDRPSPVCPRARAIASIWLSSSCSATASSPLKSYVALASRPRRSGPGRFTSGEVPNGRAKLASSATRSTPAQVGDRPYQGAR